MSRARWIDGVWYEYIEGGVLRRYPPWQKPYRGTMLNRSHPLARGLVGAWVLNEGTGLQALDSVSDNVADLHTVTWEPGGVKIGTSIGDGLFVSSPSSIFGFGTGQYSIFFRGIYEVTGAAANYVLSYDSFDPGWAVLKSSQKPYIYEDPDVLEFNYALTQGVKYTLAYVREGTGTNETHLYANGIYRASITHPDSINTPGGVGLGVHDDVPSNAWFQWGDLYEFCYVYNRALSLEEIQQLHREPYCMFR